IDSFFRLLQMKFIHDLPDYRRMLAKLNLAHSHRDLMCLKGSQSSVEHQDLAGDESSLGEEHHHQEQDDHLVVNSIPDGNSTALVESLYSKYPNLNSVVIQLGQTKPESGSLGLLEVW